MSFAEFFSIFWWQAAVVAVISYAIGGVNFAILFSKTIKHADIRSVGSGNAGTTNVFRVFGLGMGALTFLCDSAKGAAVCLVCKLVFNDTGCADVFAYCAGLFAVIGHVFPAYHKFRGGKGVATSIGVCAVTQPLLTLCCVVPALAVIAVTDRMSVMSVLFSVFMITWHWAVLRESAGVVACTFVTVMFAVVLYAHRHNILRLLCGKELPTGVREQIFKKKNANVDDIHDNKE